MPSMRLDMLQKNSLTVLCVLLTIFVGITIHAEGADREWAMRITRLNKLEARIKADKVDLQAAVKAKDSGQSFILDSNGKKMKVLPQIIHAYKDLMKSMNEYNHQKEILKYRYPEEGAVIDRHYVLMHKKSLHDYETQSGLDLELSRIKKKIDHKYAPFTKHKIKPTAEQIDRAHGIHRAKLQKNSNTAGRLKLSE